MKYNECNAMNDAMNAMHWKQYNECNAMNAMQWFQCNECIQVSDIKNVKNNMDVMWWTKCNGCNLHNKMVQ